MKLLYAVYEALLWIEITRDENYRILAGKRESKFICGIVP
jgi:hypothetical protein